MLKRSWHSAAMGSFLLVCVASFMGDHPVPLYDGVGMPDEPYRYIKPPESSLATKEAASSVSMDISLSKGRNNNDFPVATKEIGPQASIYFVGNTLKTAHTADHLTVTITPLAPDRHPADGPIVGNIYTIASTSAGGTVTMVTGVANAPAVSLRLAQGHGPGATMVYRTNAQSSWKTLPTDRSGEDIYSAPAQGFGDYGLIDVKRTEQTTNSDSSSPIIIAALSSVIVVIAAILIMIRHNSRRR